MNGIIEYIKKFIASVLSSDKGSISFGRTLAMVITAFVLGWDTANLVFAWKFNHFLAEQHMPLLSLLPDAITMAGQVAFCTAFYGVTKVADVRIEANAGNATNTTNSVTTK